MRKFVVGGLYVGVLLTSCLVPFSCKEEEPFVKPNLSFALKTLTVNEADDIIEVEVILDKAFSEDITIEYSLSGDAVEKVDAGTSSYDYEIISDYLEVEILEGETVGKIEIQLYSDLDVEDDEIIDIQIESVDSEQIEITRDDRLQITVEQEDGIAVVLAWGTAAGATSPYTDVDMDLFLWAPSTTTDQLVLTGVSAVSESVTSPEILFLPTAILPDATYGLSYNYYQGSVEPMKFKVSFVNLINGLATAVPNGAFEKEYMLANINPWYTSEVDPLLSQTFKKTGTIYSDFSEITIATSGSRTSSISEQPLPIRKGGLSKSYSEAMKSLLNR